MCLHRGCGKSRSQKCRKCKGQDKMEKCGNLLLDQFPFTKFFDSSCYQMIQVHFQIFLIPAAMKIPNTEF